MEVEGNRTVEGLKDSRVSEDECLVRLPETALIKLFIMPGGPRLPVQRFVLCQTLQASPFVRVGQMPLSWATPKEFLSSLAWMGRTPGNCLSPAESGVAR